MINAIQRLTGAEVKGDVFEQVESVVDRSDASTNRIRVRFRNGLTLSVIRGPYTYGGSMGLFEIAVIDQDGEFMPSLFDEKDSGDDVLGHCSPEKVLYYLEKVANYGG